MAVYVSNIVIESGATFDSIFEFEDFADESAFDLTDNTVSAQLRKHYGSPTAVSFASTITSAAGGKISIELTPTQTSSLKQGRYVYDIVIESTGGKKTKLVEGSAIVRPGVTR